MKKYFLFLGVDNYLIGPVGGWYDFKGSFDDVRKAENKAKSMLNKEYCETKEWVWWHIVDSKSGNIIKEG